jgi:hypothetical protein
MNLHFITSISKEYWYATGQYCIPTWDLPGKITVFVEQSTGDIGWIKEIPFEVSLLSVPTNQALSGIYNRKKVLKFWGKSYAQILSHRNRDNDERIIWIDADVAQLHIVSDDQFNFEFENPVAMMNSGDSDDCWETGMVIFNHQYPKIGQFINRYEDAWHNAELLNSLWKPYDALVLGHMAEDRGYFNLCLDTCKNIDAMRNSVFHPYFKHWINKTNKEELGKHHESSDISQDSTECEESGEDRSSSELLDWDNTEW